MMLTNLDRTIGVPRDPNPLKILSEDRDIHRFDYGRLQDEIWPRVKSIYLSGIPTTDQPKKRRNILDGSNFTIALAAGLSLLADPSLWAGTAPAGSPGSVAQPWENASIFAWLFAGATGLKTSINVWLMPRDMSLQSRRFWAGVVGCLGS